MHSLEDRLVYALTYTLGEILIALLAMFLVSRVVGPSVDVQSSRLRWLWPSINSPATAERATKYGYGAALLAAGLRIAGALIVGLFGARLFGLEHYQVASWQRLMFNAGFYFAVAQGIRRSSRTAACVGLGMYLCEIGSAWFAQGRPLQEGPGDLASMLLLLCFIHGTRGAFAVHQYRVDMEINGSGVAA